MTCERCGQGGRHPQLDRCYPCLWEDIHAGEVVRRRQLLATPVITLEEVAREFGIELETELCAMAPYAEAS